MRKNKVEPKIGTNPEQVEKAYEVLFSYFSGKSLEAVKAQAEAVLLSSKYGTWINGTSRTGHKNLPVNSKMKKIAKRLYEHFGTMFSGDDADYETYKALRKASHEVQMTALHYHGRGDLKSQLELLLKANLVSQQECDYISPFAGAINIISNEKAALDANRPVSISRPKNELSPKVKDVLFSYGMDLDISTVVPAKIVVELVPDESQTEIEPKGFKVNKVGQPVYVFRIDWSNPITLSATRYGNGNSRNWYCCEACGKTIPSGRRVAIEADCKINGRVGLMVGEDCSRKIFGIKTEGLLGS